MQYTKVEKKEDENGVLLPIAKKSKEQIVAEKKAKKELKDANSAKVAKIWRQSSKQIFPENFEQMDDADLSSKFVVIANLLKNMFKILEEKIIIVSNYCETLDIFEKLCRNKGYPMVRLDGKTNIAIRQNMVDKFNEDNTLKSRSFIFLLSAKAGGCGLNLYGCHKMILLDPDWNPSND